MDLVKFSPCASHIKLFESLYQNSRVLKFTDLELSRESIDTYLFNIVDSELYEYYIIKNHRGNVGILGLNWNQNKSIAVLGILLEPKLAPKGTAYESIKVLLREVFDTVPSSVIKITIRNDNKPATLCAKALGFKETRVSHNDERYVNWELDINSKLF